jgi:hypothetical protein
VPEALKTPEFYLAAIQRDDTALAHVPNELMREEDDMALAHVPDELMPELLIMGFTTAAAMAGRFETSYEAETKRLYIALPESGLSLRLGSWSEGCRLEVFKNDAWSAPDEALTCLEELSGLPADGDSGPVARYLRELPPEIAQGLAPFGYGRLAMLRVCAASPRGPQLLRGAALLLWLTAPTLLRQSGGRAEALHDLLGLKQRDLLARHCGRGNKALIRLLSRIPPPTSIHPYQHRALTAILAREEASSLFLRKQNVDWGLIAFIRYHFERISDTMFRSIIMHENDSRAMAKAIGKLVTIARDTTNLGLQLGIADAPGLVAACADWRGLQGLHDAWTKRLNSMEVEALVRKHGEKLPPPPLPGAEGIEPIDSVRELFLEGKLMHHCVGGYIDDVLSGQRYIYRVTGPERATLEIQKNKAGAWEVGQVKTRYNGAPGDEVAKRAREWFSEKTLAAQGRVGNA